MEPTSEQIGEVIAAAVQSADIELLALTETEISGQWHWRWEKDRSAEWNTYKFSDMLEMYKRRCRRWEEHHNGHQCVVERVRDKYLMPRVRVFLLRVEYERATLDASSVTNEMAPVDCVASQQPPSPFLATPAPNTAADSAIKAIEFALKTDEGITFLRCWMHGDFDAIRREWPEVPAGVFIGADPLMEMGLDAPAERKNGD